MSSRKIINKILAEWNPLGVPAEIAETEYSDYVDAVISNMHSKVELKSCLTQILTEKLGLTITVPEGMNEIECVCDKLMKTNV